jgi:hypothetical protein
MAATSIANVNKPNPIYDRTAINKENKDKYFSRNTPGALKRQFILQSNADALTDRDLINHRDELLFRKFLKLVSFSLLPLGLLYTNYPKQAVLFSLIPSYFLANSVYNCPIFSVRSNYSYTFAKNSYKRYLTTILSFNNKKIVNTNEFISGAPRGQEPIKSREWLARNEYS